MFMKSPNVGIQQSFSASLVNLSSGSPAGSHAPKHVSVSHEVPEQCMGCSTTRPSRVILFFPFRKLRATYAKEIFGPETRLNLIQSKPSESHTMEMRGVSGTTM